MLVYEVFHAKRLITKKKKKKNYKSRNKLPMIIRGRSIDLGGIYKYSRQRAEMAARAMTTNRLNGY